MRNLYLIIFIPLLNCSLISAQSKMATNFKTDVSKYAIEIEVNDSNDVIYAHEKIFFNWLIDVQELSFDLVQLQSNGKGMLVDSVSYKNQKIEFKQEQNRLIVKSNLFNPMGTDEIEIWFHGIPLDGLIIGKNKFGDRTFFGDNWPDRAHHYYACNDHPSDKAYFEFLITAPSKYTVIANGGDAVKTKLGDKTIRWEYKTEQVIPTKVAVVGIAEFSVTEFGPVNATGPRVSAYVYPKNEKEGFYDLSMAVNILSWFENKIAPYPFTRLANVQSTTIYGGMENAGCIFYDERAIDGKRTMEDLIAHEIAHQWFGNSASETDWPHLWLSEGFATFLTNVYIQETKGDEAFYRQLEKDAKKIFALHGKTPLPVIDTLTKDKVKLLNANAYQKGAWFLHMLRNEIGDSLFWMSIKEYYHQFEYSNASSMDFQKVVEKTSGKNLEHFFSQWLRQEGHPMLDVKIKRKGKKSARITVNDFAIKRFFYNLEIEFVLKDGSKFIQVIKMDKPLSIKKVDFPIAWVSYTIDPKHKLLFQMR